MTEKNLRKALRTILGNSDNPESLAQLYSDEKLGKDQLIEKAVKELFSKKLLKYVNSHLEIIDEFSIENNDFKELIKYHEKNRGEDMLPLFPPIAKTKVCLVHVELISSDAYGGDVCLTTIKSEEFFICENGDVLAVEHDEIEFYEKIHVYRKSDTIPWSLSALAYEGLFPKKFEDFWD